MDFGWLIRGLHHFAQTMVDAAWRAIAAMVSPERT